ncbi:MAG: DUF4783 domain-containing protein [Bacteroidales bacterium]|nr:DUF4783 domain-containing protein [Bacteroidales bacterium]
MNWNKKIVNRLNFLMIILLFPTFIISAQEISTEIEKAFLQGDAELLKNHFDEKVRLIVLGESNQTNKTEAIKILNQFLKKYPAADFQSKFESEKANSNFIIRTMKSNDETFRVTIFFIKRDANLCINLLRIEKDNESVF